MVGQTVGKYRILDRIGRGSMGTVYRAEDKSLHREVAIKTLNADLNDPAAGRRFRAEAVAIARLNHPGIAKVYDLFEHDGQWLMAMEFVSGETLESLVTRSGPLPAEQAADLTSQALLALAHAHGMGVVHRDLKPANLMVTGGHLKIMDFGIARVAGTEHLTSAGLRMGTPAYMAPEQVLGHEIDARTDIFAMGCVLFFLATAALPFKGETAMELVQARLRDDPTPARTVRHELPVWFGQIVERALARDPANRFQTANEFHLAIERGLAGLPIYVEPPQAPFPSSLMETMLPGAMPVTGNVHDSGVQSSAATEPTTMTPPAPAKSAPKARQGIGAIPIISAIALIVVVIAAVQYFRSSGTASVTPPAPPPSASLSTDSRPPASATAPFQSAAATPTTTASPTATPAFGPTPTSTLTPTPPLTPTATPAPGSALAAGRRGATTEAPVSFDTVKVLKIAGRRGEDADATLTLGGVTIVVAPRPGTPVVMPYKSLLSATYIKDQKPRWAPGLASPPADLDVPARFVSLGRRPIRNWLVLQGQTSYLILVLSDADAEQVLKTLSDRTHVKIDRAK